MAEPDTYKVELVQVLFRHGARTPSAGEAFLAMPDYVDQLFVETYGYEQLTNAGKAQMYKFGQALRERYDDFLGKMYRPQDVHAQSTNTDRTKMSLQLVLAALYPPSPELTWDPYLPWMPIPIHTVPAELDFLLLGYDKEKYQQEVREECVRSNFTQEIDKMKADLSPFFEEKGIQSVRKFGMTGCMGIFNVLSSHKASNARLPDWYTEDLYERLKVYFIKFFDFTTSKGDLTKMCIGPLIKQFVENMNVKDKINNPRKIYLYSAHELTLGPFTRAHNIKDFDYPDYGNAVILEKLRDSKGRLCVRMLAWKDDTFITLTLANGTEFCPMTKYLRFIEHMIPTDAEIEQIFNELSIDIQKLTITDYVFNPERRRPPVPLA